MPNHLSPTTCDALRRVLGGSYTVPVGDDVTVAFGPLPDRCPAASARVEGHLWVVVDLDKPRALRHARAMISDHRGSLSPVVDLGDDDLNRDWRMQSALVPLPRPDEDEPLRVTPHTQTPWTALAACVLTGAAGVVAAFDSVVDGVMGSGLT